MVKFLDKSAVDFIVKPNDGVVVARFVNPEELSYRIAEKIVNPKSDLYISPKDVEVLIDRISTVRGVAKCAPEDTFDIKTGKRIALSHLRYKTIKSILKLVLKRIKAIRKEHDRFTAMVDDGVKFLENENDRLKKIYEEIDN
jgi:hypothetical protein